MLALRQCDRMRFHRANVFQLRAGAADEAVRDMHQRLSDDVQVRLVEQVITAVDDAGDAVLQRDDSEIGLAARNAFEERVKIFARNRSGTSGEELRDGLLTEGAVFTLKG